MKTAEDLQKLIDKVCDEASEKNFVTYTDDDILFADFYLDCGENIGVTICGEYTDNDTFEFEHYYPYMVGSNISTKEVSVIERHSANFSFAGVCDDSKIGISIIYYLQRRIEYLKALMMDSREVKKAPVILSGLASGGMIMMPLAKNDLQKKKTSHSDKKRDKLIKAAREGSEEAIQSLTIEDIDVYTTISRKIKEADVYTIVDTYFMPYGIECDLYSVLGEIIDLRETENKYTKEELYQMTLLCNGLPIDICINKKDLYGEPMVGRRFKGTIWLQGHLVTGSHS